MNPIVFEHPLYLILFPVIVTLWWIVWKEKIGFIPPNSLIRGHLRNPTRVVWLWFFRVLIALFGTLILARPYHMSTVETTIQDRTQTMIVLDVSKSMLAEDILPNRLTGAKNAIKNLINTRKDEYIACIIFAGKPFLSIPFSLDYTGIREIIDHISPEFIHQEKEGLSGTAIGDALMLANMTLSGTTGKRSIILITDGRANIGIDPRISLETSLELNIPIYTIGIGSLTGGQLFYTDPKTKKKIYFNDGSGNTIDSRIDEELLREIASKSGGKYFHIDHLSEFELYFDELGNTIKPRVEITTMQHKRDLSGFFMILFFFSFIMTTLIRKSLWKKYQLT